MNILLVTISGRDRLPTLVLPSCSESVVKCFFYDSNTQVTSKQQSKLNIQLFKGCFLHILRQDMAKNIAVSKIYFYFLDALNPFLRIRALVTCCVYVIIITAFNL